MLSAFNSISNTFLNPTIVTALLPTITSVSGDTVYMNPTVLYTFDTSLNRYFPDVTNWVYDGSMVGVDITRTVGNYTYGSGGLSVSNTNYGNTVAGTANQYVISNTPLTTVANSGLTASIWFNPQVLSVNKLMTLFDLTNTPGSKGIRIDLSGSTTISTDYT
jgi:hypothetical protein